VLSESEWYISASVGATIAGGLIRDVEASEKFLDSSCGDHPKATRDCTYSGRIDTVPSIVGRPTDPPVCLLKLAQVVSLSGLVVSMSFPVQCQS
jgi:hypothetical protein